MKNISKIPVKIITQCNSEKEFIIEIKKNVNNYKIGMIFEISMELLEEVNEDLWKNLL